MSWFSRFSLRFFDKRKDSLEEEIRTHIAMDIAARMERGESKEEAETAAKRTFGNIALVEDVTHGVWHLQRLERLIADIKYATRFLRRSPGFSLTVIMTLAIGVSATCAMFIVIDRVLLRPIPFVTPNQLVDIREAGKRGPIEYGSPYLDIVQWQKRTHTLSQVAYYRSNNRQVWFLGSSSETTHVSSTYVSANLFPMLGVHPQLGRDFLQKDSDGAVRPEDTHTLILSDAVWRENFGSDPRIIGKSIELNGVRNTVIGVMPRGFTFPIPREDSNGLPEVWQPVILQREDNLRGHNIAPHYAVLARLRSGATSRAAEAELKVIQADNVKEYTDPFDRELVTSIDVRTYRDTLVRGDTRKALLALFGASALLWLISCVNVTSLIFARSTARLREIAIRGALGASRWQVVEQLLIEGALLSGCASLMGLGFAVGILKLFEHGLKTQFSIHQNLTPNLTAVGTLLGLAIFSALLISARPAWGTAKASFETVLGQGSPQQGTGRTQHRMRAALVITEIALSLTLLVGCGLLLRTIYTLKHIPLGFRTDHIVVANMTIPSYKFVGRDMTAVLYQPLVERAKHLPGVDSATLLTEVPLGKTYRMIFTFGANGKSPDALRRQQMKVQFRAVGPEMQQVFGFRMLRGRFFTESDTATSKAVVVVNRAFAKEYYGDERDPGEIIGETLVNLGNNRQAVVVGVLDDQRQLSVAESPQPELEVCISQITPDSMFYTAIKGTAMDLAVRTKQRPAVVIPEIRELLQTASPDLAKSNFTTMDQIVEDSFGSQNLAARLLEIFGGSALLLCLAGIYGLLAYLVAQRRQEIGVRLALGAQQWNLMWLILRQAGWLLIAGLSIGVGLSYLASAGLRTLLYGVKRDDPWTMGTVIFVLFIGGLLAALIPARRAARIDPTEALRAE